MGFFTVSKEKRPVRLSEETRQFAWDSLHFVYGRDTARTPGVRMDEVEGFAGAPVLDQYDMGVQKIAAEAPVRICPGEKLSGAATLGTAISHRVPYFFGGKTPCRSISHLTVDFETVLKRGVDGIRADVLTSMERHTAPGERRFLESCLCVIGAMEVWRGRYLDALETAGKEAYAANIRNLSRVPFAPAESFYEAVQSLWFTFAFVRLCGNWPGIGRIDWLLGDYLKKDLAAGVLTLGEAREILAHFFIKGCEWVQGGNYGSGDAQHYQNIVLAGIDGEGNEVTNEVTYLVLDIIEELGISDFPTTVRLNRNTPERLLRRCAEVLRFGGGILAFYNEDLILKALTRYGYPAAEAWKFANDGCWEVQIPGKTYFMYRPFDSLRVLQQQTLRGYAPDVSYDSFEELFRQYTADLDGAVEAIAARLESEYEPEDGSGRRRRKPQIPCTVVSLFEGGCVENARSYLEDGTVYTVLSPHIGGFPDTVNSLYAIKKLVFDEKRLSFGEFIGILADDWEGQEELRRYVLRAYAYYGNDNDEVDGIASRLLHAFALSCGKREGRTPSRFPAGVSTFGRQLEWAPGRLASAHGHRKGEVLAPNCSPTPGSDREGATAIIRSYCKADLTETVTGAALDVKLLPSAVEGEDGLGAVAALLRGFVLLGGFFIQPDVENAEILKEAQRHPENYETLSVRVSGWNARFVTLCREWQDMVINENKGE